MLISLEHSFIETIKNLNEIFSEAEKQKLAESIESKYNDIYSTIRYMENKKSESDPKVIELDEIGPRLFSLNLYYRVIEENEDIPLSIVQILPTISPVRMDIMTRLQKNLNQQDTSYLRAGTVYDDGDIHSKYIDEVLEEDKGLRPME